MLRLVNINKRFHQFSLGSIDFEVQENEYFVILGPSGAGKTVLLELIAGLCLPTNGKILSGNCDITFVPPEKKGIGLVYQDCALFPSMNVQDNIIFGLKLRKKSKNEIRDKLKSISEYLKISNILDRDVRNLSGGEKQRVALARALILEPKLLLLDEPLSSLDMPLRELLRKELKRIHSESKTTFIQVTHDFEEAVFLADRIALMQHGMIIQIGTPEEIMRRPINHFVAEFVGVRNIIKGFLVETGSDLKLFESRAMRLQVNTIVKGNCHVSIPAEDILISKEKIESSARNSMHGTIVDILPRGRTYEIIIDVGQRLIALVTKRSLEELELKKGKNVWATFKTSEIHVF